MHTPLFPIRPLAGLVLSVASLVLLTPTAESRSARAGIQLRYTALGSNGGVQGSAFMPVSSRHVRLREREEGCPGMRAIEVRAVLPRGPIREVVLEARVARQGGKAAVGARGCASATIVTTLEDGSKLEGGKGEVHISRWGLDSDQRIVGGFSQTTPRNGTPVTIQGDFSLRPPAPAGGR